MEKIVKVLKFVLIVIAAIVVFAAAGLGFLTVKEYKPAKKEDIEVIQGTQNVSRGEAFSVLTYNIGYAAYDKDENFFMDGGEKVRPDSIEDVQKNLSAIATIISEQDADITLLQEVDLDSHRSYNVDEKAYIDASIGKKSLFAYNFNVVYVPFPIPPIGKVMSGIVTYNNYDVREASRISLPEAFSWPVKTANLKRCILEERMPIEGTDKELVIMNVHLEAYDNGEGKIKQTQMLSTLLEEEYSLGNYVIVGGDFNQEFDMVNNPPIKDEDSWIPGELTAEDLPKGYNVQFADNLSTCRSLKEEYIDEETSQTYLIDGFVVSDNIDVIKLEVIDTGFECSDHNPVRIEVKLK